MVADEKNQALEVPLSPTVKPSQRGVDAIYLQRCADVNNVPFCLNRFMRAYCFEWSTIYSNLF